MVTPLASIFLLDYLEDTSMPKVEEQHELRIQRQIAFASGLFQEDITIRTLLEAISEGVVIIDTDGTIVLANKQAETMFGYSKNELIGKPHVLLIPERFRTVHEQHMAHYFEEPKARPMGIGLDLTGLRQDGTEFPVEISLSYLQTISGTLVMAFVSDISLRKQAEMRLRESEELFRLFMNNSPTIAWVKDEVGRYVYLSKTFQERFDVSTEEWYGKTDAELWPGEYAERYRENDLEVLRLDQPLEVVENTANPDGSTCYWLNTKSPFRDAAGNRFVAGIGIDITERKLAENNMNKLMEALEHANRELEAFNYTASHDLRQPLNIISGYCQLIKETCSANLDEKCKGYLRETYNGAVRMNQLISALVEFSRMAHVEPRRELVDLSAMAENAAAELRLADPERQVTFHIADGITVNGDPRLLKVVLDNLLGNAWKYTSMREEGIIGFGATEIDGKPVYFVRDNGSGFDMADAGRLFIPFQRLRGAEQYKGSGIGLATVERIIQRHGGRVWADGTPDKGACFYFTL